MVTDAVQDSKKIPTSVGNARKMGVSAWSNMAKVQLSRYGFTEVIGSQTAPKFEPHIAPFEAAQRDRATASSL
jgi:hypothetical protein